MKTINLRSGLLQRGFAIACLFGGMMLFAAPTKAAVNGKNYDVKVQSSQGNSFTACFQFDNSNNLQIDGLQAVYDGTNLGKNQTRWQAVTKPSLPQSVGFSGRVSGGFIPDQNLSGDAINSNGTTFRFTGKLTDQACPVFRLAPGAATQSPFLK